MSLRWRIFAISCGRSASWGRWIAAGHDAAARADERSEEREGGREQDYARGGDHRLDDGQGTANHKVIDGARRRRIAKGSGTSVQEVNQVVKQYLQMRTMMKQYGAMAARAKMKGLGKLAGFG